MHSVVFSAKSFHNKCFNNLDVDFENGRIRKGIKNRWMVRLIMGEDG